MALAGEGGDSEQYGIQITVTYEHSSTALGSQNPSAQLWRTGSSTSDAAAPSTGDWSVITALAPASHRTYTDVLPNDGQRRFYRVRHTQAGYSPSTYYNDWTSAVPRKGPFPA